MIFTRSNTDRFPISPVELLSPAGSEECLHAAVENGADAVYFGISGRGNFNARSRAQNFPLEKLGEVVEFLHRRNVRAYLTLNTLVFADELAGIEEILREFVRARVDAVLVQDLGIARLAHHLCPSLVLHASTQMSLTNAESFALVEKLGIRRVVLPRELSIEQIRALREQSSMELEAFVHGALCISFSGQCFASLALGGRSANRGQCAQPCRMPYTLLDGSREITKNPFSPTDLAALPLLRNMIEAGLCSLKIEGRLKSPQYVAEVTRIYRDALDSILREIVNDSEKKNQNGDISGKTDSHTVRNMKGIAEKMERLSLTFSRGFSSGWLEGIRPHSLVPGQILAHRGLALGKVLQVHRDAVLVQLSSSVRRGDGVLFENISHPEQSQGGRVYEIFRKKSSLSEAFTGEKILLTFGNGAIDPNFIESGQEVRKTDDAKWNREIMKSLKIRNTENSRNSGRSRKPGVRIPLQIRVCAKIGVPLEIDAFSIEGVSARVVSEFPLEEAKKHPLTLEGLREQLDRLGATPFEIGSLEGNLDGKAMVPLSILGKMRRDMVAQLSEKLGEITETEKTTPEIRWGKKLEELRAEQEIAKGRDSDFSDSEKNSVHLLFRELRFFEDQVELERCVKAGCRSFYAELRSSTEYGSASQRVAELGCEFTVVAPRISKPGEIDFLEDLIRWNPDAILVRNLEALSFFRDKGIPCIGDFSLNVVNDLSFQQLLDFGVQRITLGWDLDESRMSELLEKIPVSRVEMIVLGRVPLFTMEHCLWKANLLEENRPCSEMCRTRPLKVRDRRGAVHTVRSDPHCRNIVENGTPIPLSDRLESWRERGVEHLRIEWDERLGFLRPSDAAQLFLR